MLVTHVRLSHVLLSHIQDTRGTTRRHRPGIELAAGTNALGMLHRGKRPEPRPFRQVTTAFRQVLVTGCKIGQIRPGQWGEPGRGRPRCRRSPGDRRRGWRTAGRRMVAGRPAVSVFHSTILPATGTSFGPASPNNGRRAYAFTTVTGHLLEAGALPA